MQLLGNHHIVVVVKEEPAAGQMGKAAVLGKQLVHVAFLLFDRVALEGHGFWQVGIWVMLRAAQQL